MNNVSEKAFKTLHDLLALLCPICCQRHHQILVARQRKIPFELIEPQSDKAMVQSFNQRWEPVRETGKQDEAIAELKEAMKNDRHAPGIRKKGSRPAFIENTTMHWGLQQMPQHWSHHCFCLYGRARVYSIQVRQNGHRWFRQCH